MSQRNVERVIGRLLTDEAFRHRFARDPVATLRELNESGCELNPCELRALASIDAEQASSFAESLDPRILKCDIQAGAD